MRARKVILPRRAKSFWGWRLGPKEWPADNNTVVYYLRSVYWHRTDSDRRCQQRPQTDYWHRFICRPCTGHIYCSACSYQSVLWCHQFRSLNLCKQYCYILVLFLNVSILYSLLHDTVCVCVCVRCVCHGVCVIEIYNVMTLCAYVHACVS
jgi:hypothetical protein